MLIVSKVALVAALILALSFACRTVLSSCAAGRATAIDGDSLLIGDVSIDLFGLDAPELEQQCISGKRRWPCGRRAAAALQAEIDGRWLFCRTHASTTAARCFRGLTDIGSEMVSQGWALSESRLSSMYVDDEQTARASLRGIWSSRFEAPAMFRARQPLRPSG